MKWKLTAGETAGVVAIGLGLGWLSSKVSNNFESQQGHQRAMIAGGAAVYTAGVVIGANRPKKGYLGGY